MSDLNALLRAHADRSEPVLAPDPAPAVRAGRRRLRDQRVALVATAAIVVTAAGIGATALAAGGDPSAHSGVDPATTRALADYDPLAMPGILDDHVSEVLGRSVAGLGPADFYAGDGQGARLDPEDYDKASGMSVSYGGQGDHRWSVSLSHARSEAEGNARENCANDVRAGVYLTCDVSITDAGDVVIRRVTALRPLGGDSGWKVVDADHLDRGDPSTLWFSHDVKVVHSETFLTYAEEVVRAPALDAAEDLFEVPVDDLVEIGTDPALVIPPPPTDDSGCGPWTRNPGVSYSC